jgi:hypothetical protein
MKLRLLVIGALNSALAAILIIARGFSDALAGLLAIGLVVLVVGLIWKQQMPTGSAQLQKLPQPRKA